MYALGLLEASNDCPLSFGIPVTNTSIQHKKEFINDQEVHSILIGKPGNYPFLPYYFSCRELRLSLNLVHQLSYTSFELGGMYKDQPVEGVLRITKQGVYITFCVLSETSFVAVHNVNNLALEAVRA